MLVVSELLSEERQVELRGNYGGSQRLYRAGSAWPDMHKVNCVAKKLYQHYQQLVLKLQIIFT